MKAEKDFLAWLYGAKFYHGTTRYSQFTGNHVFASSYNDNEELKDTLDDLEGGDIEAIDAGNKLAKWRDDVEIWMYHDDDPAVAMAGLVDIIRKYYFGLVNKE